MPDANTGWLIAFTVATFVIGGLAFWSYYHRDTYIFPFSVISLVSTIVLIVQVTVNGVLGDVGNSLQQYVRPELRQKFVDEIVSRAYNPWYSALVLYIGLGAAILMYTPSKRG